MMLLKTVTFATLLTVISALQQQQPQMQNAQHPQPSPQLAQAASLYNQFSAQNEQDLRNLTTIPESPEQRLSNDKREVIQFLNAKNILKTMFKMIFGNQNEMADTSREVLNIFVKMLELLKSQFGQRARSSSTSRVRDALDGAAMAGLSMFQGYVKSIMTTNRDCIQRNICESAASATKESRDLGTFIANLGGYAASSMLEFQRHLPFSVIFEASRLGRTGGDCRKQYKFCPEEKTASTVSVETSNRNRQH